MDKLIKREIEDSIRKHLNTGKTIVLYGARQVGKTTLLQQIFGKDIPNDGILWLNGDSDSTLQLFEVTSAKAYEPLFARYKTVIIDEAQRIPNIGLKLKVLHDNFGKTTQFVVTGSSSFDLANKIVEPMTGRTWTYWLPSLSVRELSDYYGPFDVMTNLDNRLIYGTYPGVVTDMANAQETLNELATSNLYRDVLTYGEIIKTDKLRNILEVLALQVGNQVNMTELASLVELDRKTVDKYISLLEQSFVIFRLRSYAKNMRNELKFAQKIYFYDVGIRNALIQDYTPIGFRSDVGALFENYIVAELKKKYHHNNIFFWRNNHQQEIDFIVRENGRLYAFEAKYNEKKKARIPGVFEREYHPASYTVINRENYWRVLGE
jgi:predicted AAA+ superfamily ATPase